MLNRTDLYTKGNYFVITNPNMLLVVKCLHCRLPKAKSSGQICCWILWRWCRCVPPFPTRQSSSFLRDSLICFCVTLLTAFKMSFRLLLMSVYNTTRSWFHCSSSGKVVVRWNYVCAFFCLLKPLSWFLSLVEHLSPKKQ